MTVNPAGPIAGQAATQPEVGANQSTPPPAPPAGSAPASGSAVVAAVRDAFGDVGLRSKMPACPHCITDADLAGLTAGADALDAASATRFARKAVTTWGQATELKWLLPRLLADLLADDRLDQALLVCAKLHRGHWDQWPARQQAAVQAVLDLWWAQHLVARSCLAPCALRRLSLLARAAPSVARYLTHWDHQLVTGDAGQQAAALQLAALVLSTHADGGITAGLSARFAEAAGPADEEVATWLKRSTTRIALDQARSDVAGHGHAPALDTAAVLVDEFAGH